MTGVDAYALLLAGGSGERFWPLSRRARPKQFLRLAGEQSLLRQTYARAVAACGGERVWILTRQDLVGTVRRELPELAGDQIVGETQARNTGPAVALGCRMLAARDPRAVAVVLPSDHWIPDGQAFVATLDRAVHVARREGGLVTLGIKPRHPATGYGYVERGGRLEDIAGAFRAVRFHEKPDRRTAAGYLAAGKTYWNSGIFVWRAGDLLAEIERQQPEIDAHLPRDEALSDPQRRPAAVAAFFERAPSISIDYGVMEGARDVWVVEADFPWSDLGSWEAWAELVGEDESGNRTEGDVRCRDARGNIVCSSGTGRVALLGVNDMIVVRAGDVTLVCPRDRVQEIRDLVRGMREDDHDDPYL
ncbi:MAG: NTP transferase domain-containing protein [Candidatus Eisenbacteria bacterium]|nr:NTP transferase domain-containing protein [Candidatus Eisenbacteria bacterium]